MNAKLSGWFKKHEINILSCSESATLQEDGRFLRRKPCQTPSVTKHKDDFGCDSIRKRQPHKDFLLH